MKKRNVIILVLLLVIGFASVSTSLILNGTIGIASKQDDFDVIFTDATLDGNETSKATISEDKKSITFTSKMLRELNDYTILDYKVKNTSTQYGANVTISCNTYGNEYVSVTGELDGKTIPLTNPVEIEAQGIKNGFIKAEIVKVYGGEEDSISITCTLTASATEKDTVTDYVPHRYREDALNGTDPVLANGLIPVELADDGTVTYADVTDEWYDYENKKWANAVILEDNVSYNVGDIISEDSIEAYFVWIPKYRYKLFDLGNYDSVIDEKPAVFNSKEIQIEFTTENTKDVNGKSCATPMTSGATGDCDVDEWMTHPAFISMDTIGLWVGKFETGYEATTELETHVTSVEPSKVIIKPNVYSWRYNTAINMFKTAYDYNRDLNSHMMKNTEWGAVAYLSFSKYGINSEINVNNNSDYLTGYSTVEGIDQSSYPGTSGNNSNITLPYNTPTGYKASTTGNISGVYDMSGGSDEFVVSVVDGEEQLTFTPEEIVQYKKYIDFYTTNSSVTAYNNRILGDATGEVGPFYNYLDNDGNNRNHTNWNGDGAYFPTSSNSWLRRGGFYNAGILAGQLRFLGDSGGKMTNTTSRIVLAV